ncbi:hypothetical protein PYCC9005_005852 [Savitreella phatthalungensis]
MPTQQDLANLRIRKEKLLEQVHLIDGILSRAQTSPSATLQPATETAVVENQTVSVRRKVTDTTSSEFHPTSSSSLSSQSQPLPRPTSISNSSHTTQLLPCPIRGSLWLPEETSILRDLITRGIRDSSSVHGLINRSPDAIKRKFRKMLKESRKRKPTKHPKSRRALDDLSEKDTALELAAETFPVRTRARVRKLEMFIDDQENSERNTPRSTRQSDSLSGCSRGSMTNSLTLGRVTARVLIERTANTPTSGNVRRKLSREKPTPPTPTQMTSAIPTTIKIDHKQNDLARILFPQSDRAVNSFNTPQPLEPPVFSSSAVSLPEEWDRKRAAWNITSNSAHTLPQLNPVTPEQANLLQQTAPELPVNPDLPTCSVRAAQLCLSGANPVLQSDGESDRCHSPRPSHPAHHVLPSVPSLPSSVRDYEPQYPIDTMRNECLEIQPPHLHMLPPFGSFDVNRPYDSVRRRS